MALRAAALITVLLTIALGCGGGGDGDNTVRPGVEEHERTLPSNFPEEFPLPPGSDVVVSGDLTGGVALVLFDAEAPKRGFRDFFVDRLPDEGWSLVSCSQTPATPAPVGMLVAVKGRLQANITAGYLDVDYPIAYDGPFSFAVQYWTTKGAFATPSAVPETCTRPLDEAPASSPSPRSSPTEAPKPNPNS